MWCAAAGSVLLTGLAVALAVTLDRLPAQVAVNVTGALAQLAAATACFLTARRRRGAERHWRMFIGITTVGNIIANIGTIRTDLVDGSSSASYSPAQLAFFALYAPALAGLLTLPTDPLDGSGADTARRRRGGNAITLLDGLMIAGSLALLEWTVALAAVVRQGLLDPLTLAFALISSFGTLILATAVLLIACFRRPRSPAALLLLGAGMLAFSITSNGFVFIVARASHDFPPEAYLGFTVSFLLMGLAALVPDRPTAVGDEPAAPGPRTIWAHAVLPYGVLAITGATVSYKLLSGKPLDRLETLGILGLLLVALVRQMVTLAENTRLLAGIREHERLLHHQAFHDPLTGLANRALFTRRLRRALECDADGTEDAGPPISLLFVDLDEFKQVNDTFGHVAGDELLKISAERLRAGTRAADTVARLGGDEFAVILDGDDPDHPCRIAERLAAAIHTPCLLAGRPYTPRASVGLVVADAVRAARPASPDVLLHQADLAMYAAKRERAGRPVIYRPDLSEIGDQPLSGHP